MIPARTIHPLKAPGIAILCALALGLLLAGCVSNSKLHSPERADRLLLRHNFDETRMSTTPAQGLVPTGVWRVRGNQNTVYLAATVHVVTTNQLPFPSTYYAAYNDSAEIYLEVDEQNSRISNFRLTFQMTRWLRNHSREFFYPKGHTLADELAPETISRLQQHYGRDYKKVQTMRPVFVVFMAQAQEMGSQFIEEGGVDDVFAARARADRKPIHALDDSSVNDVVLLALDEMVYEIQRDIQSADADKVISEAVFGESEPIDERDWRTGDLAAAQREIDEMKTTAPDLYRKIAPERNHKWLKKITAALQRNHNVMIFAGVAHFPGPDGILELLAGEGFKVEQLYGVDPLSDSNTGQPAASQVNGRIASVGAPR